MSWRAESNFKAASALNDDEKNFLKVAKKIRESLKLEEKARAGDKLDAKQQEKIQAKDAAIKELVQIAGKLPGKSEVFDKNPDMVEYLPRSLLQNANQKKEEDARRERQDAERRSRKEEAERAERNRIEPQYRHARPITDVTVSSDGKYIYTASKDKYVIGWSTKDKLLAPVFTFGGHDGAVWAIDISPEPPMRLATGGADGKLFLWPATGKQNVIPADVQAQHGGIIRVIRYCPFDSSLMATATEKFGATAPFIATWRVSGRSVEQQLKLTDLPGKANDMRWCGGQKTKIFSAHDNGYIGVWDAEPPGKLLKTLKLHTGPVTSLFLAADGITLLTSSKDGSALAVNVSTPEMPTIQTWKANRGLNAVAASPDYPQGKDAAVVIAGGRNEREVTTSKLLADEFEAFIHSADGDLWGSGKGHFGPVHALRFVPGSGVCSVSEDGCVRVHDLYGELLHADTAQ